MILKNISWWTIVGLIVQTNILKTNGYPYEDNGEGIVNINYNGIENEDLNPHDMAHQVPLDEGEESIKNSQPEGIEEIIQHLQHHHHHHHSSPFTHHDNHTLPNDQIDNIDYLKSIKKNELYDIKHIYNNTYHNPIYYLNQVHKFVKRDLEMVIDEEIDEEETDNSFFLFGDQLDGFSLFVYQCLLDIAFSATRGVKLSTFYYYGINFFEVVQDTQINALISTGYSAL